MPLPKGLFPRDYQMKLFEDVREAFRTHRAVLAEAPTGSGKSVLMSLIVDSFEEMNKKWKLDRHIYFLVDENFLLDQFSGHLEKWGIRHDLVTSGKHEGRPVNVHVCTVQSLRLRPPKNKPAFFIVDEAHLSTSDSFMNLFHAYPEAKILGLTASPETGSGKGLKASWLFDDNGIPVLDENGRQVNEGNGIFDVMVESPVSMLDLTELGFLSPIRYFGVPISGIETLHMQCGDYKEKEVEKLLKEKGTYGDSIREMQKFPDIKSHILFFCKSVKACYEMQTVLQANHYVAEVLEGRLTKRERRKMMKNFESGATQVLVTCRMVLKGVDLPWLLMGVDCAPVASRSTQRQKVGRVGRAAEGKENAIYLDMVGNHRVFPNGDIYGKIDWNFASMKYNKKPTASEADNYCPLCYEYIPPGEIICPSCGAERKKAKKKEKKGKHLDGDLVEIKPTPMSERPPEEKLAIQSQINRAIADDDIETLKKIGETLTTQKKLPIWIYFKLSKKNLLIDIQLLYRIQRSFGYKQGWIYFAKKQIRAKMNVAS